MTLSILAPEFILLPAGRFVMGNDRGRPDERPERLVQLAAFRAAVRPVSNAEYAAFVGDTRYEAPPFLQDERFVAPDQPVVGTSWDDAVAYCEWLSKRTGERHRLPSEAEREYAALGGLAGVDWPWGNEAPDAREPQRRIAALDRPHVPGPECANGYGLLCMADNVHEWCLDWYGPYETPVEGTSEEDAAIQLPIGPSTGKRRASRGGSWRHLVVFTRLSARSSLDPSFRYADYGFRVYADA